MKPSVAARLIQKKNTAHLNYDILSRITTTEPLEDSGPVMDAVICNISGITSAEKASDSIFGLMLSYYY